MVLAWMAQLGLSQAAAARRLGLATPWLRRFLRGEITHLRTPTIRRLATALGLPEPVIRLAMLSDQAQTLAGSIEEAVDAVKGSGYADIEGSAEHDVVRLRAAPIILPPLPPISDHDWETMGNRMTQRQKLAVMMLTRRDVR